MARTSSSVSYKLQSLIKLLYQYKFCPANLSRGQYSNASQSKFEHGCGCSMHQGLRLISTDYSRAHGKPSTYMVKGSKDKVQPPVPAPPRPSFSLWAKWFLGSTLSILLPFWKQKWECLLTLEGEVEKVVEEVENVAEVVEKVATVTEKVSAEVADKLPDHGKLKEAALFVEHVSNVTAMDAQLTKDFLHKVDELRQDLKDLETIAEPVIDKIIEKQQSGN